MFYYNFEHVFTSQTLLFQTVLEISQNDISIHQSCVEMCLQGVYLNHVFKHFNKFPELWNHLDHQGEMLCLSVIVNKQELWIGSRP